MTTMQVSFLEKILEMHLSPVLPGPVDGPGVPQLPSDKKI